MKKLLFTCALLLLSVIVLARTAGAMRAVRLLQHQGRLLDATGQPVTGTHVLTFRIYTDPTGGTLLHEESKTVVLESDGLFNVQIGSDVPLEIEDLVDPNETAPEALRYVEVEVDSDGPMPRMQLVSSPYALGAYRMAGDFFSAHNEILMIDSTGDTTTTLASKKLFVGGLSWGVAVDSAGRSEMLMKDTGPSGERARIATHTPEWTNSNDHDPGMTVTRVGTAGDSAEARIVHDHIGLSAESTTDETGQFWFMDVTPGATGGVTQTLIARASSTDSVFGQIKVDSSEAGLRMNKGELINEIASKAGSAHVSLIDISAADKGKILMQHNQTDLEFLMRLHNTADTAQLRMLANTAGPELQLSTESGGTTQSAARVTDDSYTLTRAQLSVPETVFEVNANGTATGAALRVRYPSLAGGASEILLGDLDGDAIPDLSVAGNVGIGSATPTEKLHVVGNICVTGGYLTCSDARYKTDVEPIHDAMGQLRKLQGVEFNWRRREFADRDFPESRQMGFVAQEVQKVLPGVVREGSDGYLAMDYARLTPLLVEALKAQQERIDRLEALLLDLSESQATR